MRHSVRSFHFVRKSLRNAFIKDFRDQYRDKTHCADDYRVAECANAPKDETTDTGPSQSAQPEPQTPTTTAPSTTTP